MNGTETMAALREIAHRYQEQYDAQIEALSKDAKLERKALLIQRNMAGHCASFARMEYNGHIYDTRERMIFRSYHYFDVHRDAYAQLAGDERESFLIYAHAISMVRGCFYDKHKAELAAAEASGNVEGVFEQLLICGVVGQILDDWRAWWKKNGTMDCGGI
ncbi:MAG: hypothetical protein IJ493_03495 [Clostridia bacterium]|nr:hypothetical protein [Clostridia bacterium]